MGTTKDVSSESNWPWPEALDARVAAPDHHKPLFENERVRVLESWAEPGETIPVHTHCWAGPIYILSWSDFIRRDPAKGPVTSIAGAIVAPEPLRSSTWC